MDVVEAAAAKLARSLETKSTTDLTAVLARPEVDAVVITTTSGAHHAAVLAAAAARKHVFVEKPLALTVEESLECVAACEAAGVILQVGFMRRFDTDIRRVRDLVKQGAVGNPHIVRVRSFDGIKQPTPYYATSGGIFMDCTIHDIDTARYIAGSEIVEVHTTATANDRGFAEFDDVDTVLVALKFANGAIGSIENSRFAAYGHDTQAEVFGEQGKVHCGPNHANSVVLATKDGNFGNKSHVVCLFGCTTAKGVERVNHVI